MVVKGANAIFTLRNGQVYAESDFFRNIFNGSPERVEEINNLERMTRENFKKHEARIEAGEFPVPIPGEAE